MSNIGLYLLLFVVCLVLSAFFSSSETAFTAIQRVKLEHLLSNGIPGSKRVSKMVERPEKFLSTILLGNNLVNTAAAALGTALAVSIGERYGMTQGQNILIATLVVTAFLLIFSETTPKTFAAQHAEKVALLFVRPLGWIAWLFNPFVLVLSWIASGFSKTIGGAPVPRSLVSAEEIRTMISLGHREGTVEEDEAEMLHKVFDFGDRTVREVMVPRPEVVAIQQGSSVSDFLALYSEFPMSRFPVFKDNMDNVVGVLSVKDVLMAFAKNTINEESTIDSLLRPAYFAPESKAISELFAEMRDENYRMCVVVDEYGDTVGIVSLTRLVEEIVGEVGDELG
ncbi:MAG: hypothetical protein A2144_02590 [Chloroflexi bacterium RBG_16_50_9]|nr:MAG: hypothetical protein A2144_02590 [Chloroflexi bacterium RBG_16_50_9]